MRNIPSTSKGENARQKSHGETEEKQGEAAAAYRGAGVEGGLNEVVRAGEEHVEVPPSLGLRRGRVRGSHRRSPAVRFALPCLGLAGEGTTNLVVTGTAGANAHILSSLVSW
jgi:hypothetical protein